ncbi:helix-turn-helix domain-containing protein [Salipiger sp. PrR003]|uniref:helix-turn-helix domain-containing protein n=1 Tax=Salipiger sp. PrR003 TaxID=2706776 RepID=UPI0013DCB633|nr:helix-turn-helix domain-containing protein [Salipiger sp. PrR003]NDV51571.1 helix-turn-helix domain-containing protein [Salipiger sp. PrR003]
MADITSIDIQKARQLRRSGLSLEHVADRAGCSRGRLSRALKRDGDPLPNGVRPRLRNGGDDRAVKMRRSGAKLDDIATALGVGRTTVWRMLHRAGMTGGAARRAGQ